MSASKKSPAHLANIALGMVLEERIRQVDQKGYTREHDDQHANEELAAASAFYMLPSWMDPDVCRADDSGRLSLQSLQDMVGEGAWESISRDHDYPEDSLDLRIKNVVRGCALALAELERLVRLQRGGR